MRCPHFSVAMIIFSIYIINKAGGVIYHQVNFFRRFLSQSNLDISKGGEIRQVQRLSSIWFHFSRSLHDQFSIESRSITFWRVLFWHTTVTDGYIQTLCISDPHGWDHVLFLSFFVWLSTCAILGWHQDVSFFRLYFTAQPQQKMHKNDTSLLSKMSLIFSRLLTNKSTNTSWFSSHYIFIEDKSARVDYVRCEIICDRRTDSEWRRGCIETSLRVIHGLCSQGGSSFFSRLNVSAHIWIFVFKNKKCAVWDQRKIQI